MNKEIDEQDLDELFAHYGVELLPERRAGVIAVYRDLMAKAALLRHSDNPHTEPASVFDVNAVLATDASSVATKGFGTT